MNSGMPLTREVEPSADGLRAARQLVVESMRQWCIDERTANAAVDIANELMTNAVQHARPPISVRVELDAPTGAITVVVSDGAPTPRRPLPHRAGCGRRARCPTGPGLRSGAWAWASSRSSRPPGGNDRTARASRSGRRSTQCEA